MTLDSTIARNCIATLLALAMLLCTLGAGRAQQPQSPQSNIGDQIPQGWGGLPPDAPPRPKEKLPTPAVHDLPPPRGDRPLSIEEWSKLQRDLLAARDRLHKRGDANDANAAATPARQKAGKPAAAKPKQ